MCQRGIGAILLCALLCVSAYGAELLSETKASGTCGNGLTWRLDADGVFTVSGKGVMEDYASLNAPPWRAWKAYIDRVNIEYGVTHVGNFTFSGCPALTALVIPSTVRTVGESAFSDCEALTDVSISEGLLGIGTLGFSGCASLETCELPESVTALGQSAFSRCTALTEFRIPSKVAETRTYLFSGCTALRSVTLPDALRVIGQRSFTGCTALAELSIPDDVSTIGKYAFENCTALRTATLPPRVDEIDSGVFYGCASLESVRIPESVRNIRQAAFGNCPALKDVFYGGTAAQWKGVSTVDFADQISKYFIKVHYGQREAESDVEIESVSERNGWLYVKVKGNPEEGSALLTAYYAADGRFLNMESHPIEYAGIYTLACDDDAATLAAFVLDSRRRPSAAVWRQAVIS